MTTHNLPRHLEVLAEAGPAPGDLSGKAATGSPTRAGSASDRVEPGYLLVGELAKATGKTVRALHLYEALGLLRPHERSKGRYRLYSADSVLRVRWITKLQSLGLSLTEIQELVRSQSEKDSAMFAAAHLRDVYASKLNATREKIRELEHLERELVESLEYLSGCDIACLPELPAGSCSCCALHRDRSDAPDLVAGVRAH